MSICRNIKSKIDNSGRFGIGVSFLLAQKPADSKPADNAVIAAISKESEQNDSDRTCQLCNISVTSKPQMKLHLEGSKHAKKLKASGEPPQPSNSNDTILQSLIVTAPLPKRIKKTQTDSTIATISTVATTSTGGKQRDNSIYRTPSGCYYCQPCNITLATESFFNQHLDSKRHLKCRK